MQIHIWSDIRCPFCYIGKRNFTAALDKFQHKDKITVEWKSFELDPNLKTQTDINAIDHFMQSKGVDEVNAKGMFNRVTEMASGVGLNFKIEDIVTANSLNAHRLLQYAKTVGFADSTKEALLKAHLVDGKNIDDIAFLVNTAISVGMDKTAVEEIYKTDAFTYEVRQDEMEAKNLGISGVPFFVLNNKYGVSGAQPVEAFTEALEQAWEKHQKEQLTVLPTTGGESCDVNGNCC